MIVDLNGNKQEFQNPVTVEAIAESLGDNFKKNALCGKVNGKLVDLSYVVDKDSEVQLLTFKDDEGRKVFNHTASHVLAQAVKTIYPTAKLALGPATDNGFYCDFEFKTPPTMEDLEVIEAEMSNIIKANLPMTRSEMSRETAYSLMGSFGEVYKLEIIEARPEISSFSIYRQGNFADLCSGPHLKSTGLIKAFKLLSIGGAYWMDDKKNNYLTRIYGIAFDKKASLQSFLEDQNNTKKEESKGLKHSSFGFRKKNVKKGLK